MDGKAKALEEMVEVIDAWNGYLEPFNMFLALIQFDDATQEDVSQSYSLYLGPKELVRVGVHASRADSLLSKLTLKGEGDRSEVHESGFPEMLRIVDSRDGVLRYSDDGCGSDEVRRRTDRQ